MADGSSSSSPPHRSQDLDPTSTAGAAASGGGGGGNGGTSYYAAASARSPWQLVILHGKPACGKLTVAQELCRLTGLRLFDNHLIVNAVLALYDFGTPGFVQLRGQLWRTSFATMLQMPPGGGGVVFTFNPENTVPQEFIDDLLAMFGRSSSVLQTEGGHGGVGGGSAGGDDGDNDKEDVDKEGRPKPKQKNIDAGNVVVVKCVEVVCDEAVIEQRMDLASRHAKQKLTSKSLYVQLRDSGVFDSPKVPADLQVETSKMSATQAAEHIAAWLSKK